MIEMTSQSKIHIIFNNVSPIRMGRNMIPAVTANLKTLIIRNILTPTQFILFCITFIRS